jgi:hypothetical protein
VGSRAFKPRKSKLDAFAKIIGVEPDATVAAKADVTSETVRTYRVRRGIPARWRGEIARPLQTDEETGVPVKRPFRGRRSKLDPYRDLLGSVPDGDVAVRAGVTTENVRAYRRRRGITAVWRDGSGRPSIDSVVSPSNGSMPSTRPSRRAARSAATWAYRVTAGVAAEEHEFVVLGSSLSDAAVQAERRLSQRNPRARLLSVAVLAEAL